jgi:hypothetical protein
MGAFSPSGVALSSAWYLSDNALASACIDHHPLACCLDANSAANCQYAALGSGSRATTSFAALLASAAVAVAVASQQQ